MAFTQANLDALTAAYTRGVLRVTFPSGHIIQYASMAELRTAIADAQRDLNRQAGQVSPRHSIATFHDD